jgi:lysophospholipase
MLRQAPLRADLAQGPDGAAAFRVTTADGVGVRLVVWPRAGARGCVLILPGRTEYAEKYGPVAADLARAGLAAAAIDWRGQGLADRLLPDPMKGHVGRFAEYQADLDACLLALAAREGDDMPRPRLMLAHSMGGAIGLRALLRGAGGFAAAAFSAPMWGLVLGGGRAFGWAVALAARAGLGARYCPPPASGPRSYVATASFADNALTTDPEAFARIRNHLDAEPRLGLGGPTLGWLAAALAEMRALRAEPSPALPALALLGSDERVVDPAAIRARMARWPGGRLVPLAGARHEPLTEAPARRAARIALVLDHLLPATGARD